MVFGAKMSSRLIRAVEENTVHLGIPLTLLMENAGKCVADAVMELAPKPGSRIIIVAGKGGNGGDGLAAARFLRAYGHRVEVVLLYPHSEVSHPDARLNLEHLKRAGLPLKHPRDPSSLGGMLQDAQVIVDAILGTGAKPPLRPPVAPAIRAINQSPAKVVAVDVPTGVDPDKGPLGIEIVRADITVAMHYYKPGYTAAQEYLGELRLCNVGIPPEAESRVGPGHVRHLIKPRPPDAHKGQGGRVLVVGGSLDYTGAPALAALAALASGSDLAFVLIPGRVRPIIASYSPELITIPAPDEEYLTRESLETALHHAGRADAVVIGPGLSRREESLEFAHLLIKSLSEKTPGKPMVIDADALTAIAEHKTPLTEATVLTPHRGEFKKLVQALVPGGGATGIEEEARLLSVETGATVLVKGPRDVICRGTTYLENTTGNPGMSRGGTGDLLAGVVATMLKRVGDPLYAAAIAAYVNGAAGDRAARELGDYYTTLDVLKFIPKVLARPEEV